MALTVRTGQERDGGTVTLDYFNARHFSAVPGSMTQPDPMNAGGDILNPQSWNGYGYVLGNPLGLVDPSGMFADQPPVDSGGSQQPGQPIVIPGGINVSRFNILVYLKSFHGTGTPANNGQTAGKIGWCLVKGAAVGAAGAVVVGAAVVVAAPALGVSAAAASTALFVAGVAGGVTTGVSAYVNFKSGNYSAAAFDLGSLGGGLAVGGLSGGKVGDAINQPATRGFWSVTRDIQNIFNPSKGWNLGKFMATGPDAAAAAGATGAAGSSGSVLGAFWDATNALHAMESFDCNMPVVSTSGCIECRNRKGG